MSSNYLSVVRMDVQHDKDELFNEVYDSEHVPELKKIAGVFNVGRYWTTFRTEPKYLAIFEIDNPNIRETAEWKKSVEIGRWSKEVRPYTMNRYHAIYTAEGHPPYLAIYEIEQPDIPASEAFRKEVDRGRWISEVRPYTYNKHRSVYERIKR